MSPAIEGHEPDWFADWRNLAESWEFHEGGGGFGNNELQTYSGDQVRADSSNGVFVITATSRNGIYRSAKLTSKSKFGVEEGYIEAKLSVPSAEGIWPAFWAMPGEEMGFVWPDGGEVDIMEFFGTSRKNLFCAHWGPHGPQDSHLHSVYEHKVADPTSFHTYGLAWKGNHLGFYCDRSLVHTCTPPHPPFADLKDFRLILNIAMGGNPLEGKKPAEQGNWRMEVEYVSRWRLPPGGWKLLLDRVESGHHKRGMDTVKEYVLKLSGRGKE